jgi:hypothetical protein
MIASSSSSDTMRQRLDHLLIGRMAGILSVLVEYTESHAKVYAQHSPLGRTVTALKIAQATVRAAERSSLKAVREGRDATGESV